MRYLAILGVVCASVLCSQSVLAVTAGSATNVIATTGSGCNSNAQADNILETFVGGGTNSQTGVNYTGYRIPLTILGSGNTESIVIRLSADNSAAIYESGTVFPSANAVSGISGTWSGSVTTTNGNQAYVWNVAIVANGCTFKTSGQANNIGF